MIDENGIYILSNPAHKQMDLSGWEHFRVKGEDTNQLFITSRSSAAPRASGRSR